MGFVKIFGKRIWNPFTRKKPGLCRNRINFGLFYYHNCDYCKQKELRKIADKIDKDFSELVLEAKKEGKSLSEIYATIGKRLKGSNYGYDLTEEEKIQIIEKLEKK